MPSSHSATVTALAMAIGFQEGFGGALFSVALVLACVVWFFLISLFYIMCYDWFWCGSGYWYCCIVDGILMKRMWWQVMYDATGVRLQAGRQAEVRCFSCLWFFSYLLFPLLYSYLNWVFLQLLNQIVYELPAEHPLAESRPLHELLGHTPPQVWYMALKFWPLQLLIHITHMLLLKALESIYFALQWFWKMTMLYSHSSLLCYIKINWYPNFFLKIRLTISSNKITI